MKYSGSVRLMSPCLQPTWMIVRSGEASSRVPGGRASSTSGRSHRRTGRSFGRRRRRLEGRRIATRRQKGQRGIEGSQVGSRRSGGHGKRRRRRGWRQSGNGDEEPTVHVDGVIGRIFAMHVFGGDVGADVERVMKAVHRRQQMHGQGFAVIIGEVPNAAG